MGALTDKYCIVGVGETPHNASHRTPLSMACEAVKNAMDDAGLKPSDVDAMTSYQLGDSTDVANVATALGMRLNYGSVVFGGGSTHRGAGRACDRADRGRLLQDMVGYSAR